MNAPELLPIRVRNLGRNGDHWIAEVSTGGIYIGVHNRYGSWMHGQHPNMNDILPEVAAELVRLVKKAKRKERACASIPTF